MSYSMWICIGHITNNIAIYTRWLVKEINDTDQFRNWFLLLGVNANIITRATCGSTSLGLGSIIIIIFFWGVPQICKIAQ